MAKVNFFFQDSPSRLFLDELKNLDGPLAVCPDEDVSALPPAHGRDKFIGIIILARSGRPGTVIPVEESFDDIELKAEERLGEAFEVDVERVVLRAASDVVAVRGQANEVLFIGVPFEGSMAVLCVDIPQLQLAICTGGDQIFRVEEFDIRDGFFVSLKHAQGGLGVAKIIVMDAVVGRTVRNKGK